MTGGGWRLTTPSKVKTAIWQKGWFKVYGGSIMRDVVICTLYVKQKA